IYNLSGGSLNVANIYSDSGNSMLTIDGGSLLVGGGHGNIAVTTLSIGDAVGKTAAHSLSDGSLYAEDEYIGNYGNGTIDQSAGDNTVNKRLMLGFWSGGQGIYNLSGNGAMQSEQAFIGMNGNGSFTQSGASRAYLKEIYLGLNSTGQGSFILSGGELMTSPEVIGYQGIGKFTQTGGSHTVGGLVTLGKSLGSKGSYSLSGGTLTTGGIVAGAGDAQFDWTGGNLQVTNNFNVASGASVFGKQLAVPQDSHFIAPNMGVTQDAVVTQGIGSTVTIAGKLSQLGSYTLAGGTTLQTSSLDNSGSLSIGGGVTDIYGDITNNVDGKISNNALVRFNGALVNNGNVYTDKNASSIFYGAVSGSGSFIGDGTSIFTGGLRPGNSPGLLSASGNVILGDGNQTVMELGGLKRGTEYDAFDVLPGTLALGGNLKIDWANGFTAGSGDSFDLFMADNITGIFANTLFPSLSGINWQLALLHDVYGSTDVYRLTAAAPVPLPASVWLMGMGLMGMVAGARRKA
ncbi:MAG: VPLPA-CTERM sorting domain-containing protein, partial [Methylococcales bacterium]